MGCEGFSTPFGTGEAATGSAFTKIAHAPSSHSAAWRCLEVAASGPVRLQLLWQGQSDMEQVLVCDVTRAERVYILASRFEVRARSLGAAAATVRWIISDVPGPVPRLYRLTEALAAGSYDSNSDDALRPPIWSTRLYVERGTLSGSSLDVRMLNTAGDQISQHTEATMPADGIPLAGVSRIQVTGTTNPFRLVWHMEM